LSVGSGVIEGWHLASNVSGRYADPVLSAVRVIFSVCRRPAHPAEGSRSVVAVTVGLGDASHRAIR